MEKEFALSYAKIKSQEVDSFFTSQDNIILYWLSKKLPIDT